MRNLKNRIKRLEEDFNSSENYRSTFEYFEKYYFNSTDEEQKKMKHPIITLEMLKILTSDDDE
jgi:hypothetical protein